MNRRKLRVTTEHAIVRFQPAMAQKQPGETWYASPGTRFIRWFAWLVTFDTHLVYDQRWTAGDVVIWDNRCLIHRACEWDYSEPSVILHSRFAGDTETEGAPLGDANQNAA